MRLRALHENGGYQRTSDAAMWAPLRAIRMVVMGVNSTVIRWGDNTQTPLTDDHQYVKLTEKGLSWLRRNPPRAESKNESQLSSPTSVLLSGPDQTFL